MKVKIDTKEKFTVITPEEENLSANIAAELSETAIPFIYSDTKNVVLNLKQVATIDDMAAEQLAKLQQLFYENNASFVICEAQNFIEQKLDELELLEYLNITPTESEAWDIVQMEEIERELLDNGDAEFNSHDD